MKALKHLLTVLSNEILSINSTKSYDEITEVIIILCMFVKAIPRDEEIDWGMGEDLYCSLDGLIVGAYWHYTEWHAGERSLSYKALCALGSIFTPGMTEPEYDNDVYLSLNSLAEKGLS